MSSESVALQNLRGLGVPSFNSQQSPAKIQSQLMNMQYGDKPSRGVITSIPNDFFNQATAYSDPFKWTQSQSNWGDQPQSITDQMSQLKLPMGLPATKPLQSIMQKPTLEQFTEMQKQALTQALPQQQQQQQPNGLLDSIIKGFNGGKSYRRKARKAAKKSRKARKAAKKSKRSSRR